MVLPNVKSENIAKAVAYEQIHQENAINHSNIGISRELVGGHKHRRLNYAGRLILSNYDKSNILLKEAQVFIHSSSWRD